MALAVVRALQIKGVRVGYVSGAVHTTASTVRPAMQLIRAAPGDSIVSSVFFMLMPDQALVYGDCAINSDPTSERLAEIAIQSAESAAALTANRPRPPANLRRR